MKVCLLILFLVSVQSRVSVIDESLLVKEITKIKDTVDNEISTNDELVKVDGITESTSSNLCHTRDVDDENSIEVDENTPCPENKIDNGTALILTPYIEQGLLAEARNASKVDPSLFLGIESYSGFLTVNSTYNSQTFFWYFPVLNNDRETSPWLIWLQGGPGASSLVGLFEEIGPFRMKKDGTLRFNFHTWLRNHSLVFIDNPIGTGYSYTEHEDGYVRDMETYAKHLYTATKQLVQIFPELKKAPLFVAGESYGGKYVPALGMEIHRHRDEPGFDINFKGLIVNNAYIEPKMILNVVQQFYNFGLLEREQLEIVRPFYESFVEDVKANRSAQAKEKWPVLVVGLLGLSHSHQAFNFLQDDMAIGEYWPILARSEVKRALHVGDINYLFYNTTVDAKIAPEFLSNARPLFEELLNHYSVLAYCGQLDMMLPCPVSSDVFRSWKWNGSEEFLNATRYPYLYKKRVAGYYKSGGNFTWVVIRGAGHMTTVDAPGATRDLVTHWMRGHHLPTPKNVKSPQYIANLYKNFKSVYTL